MDECAHDEEEEEGVAVVKDLEKSAAYNGDRGEGDEDEGRPCHSADLDAQVGERVSKLVGGDVVLGVQGEVDGCVDHGCYADPAVVDEKNRRWDLSDDGEEVRACC